MKLEQNYREHIKTAHPGQDSSDLSGWGDQNISDMFHKKTSQSSKLGAEETVQYGEENNNLENDDTFESPSENEAEGTDSLLDEGSHPVERMTENPKESPDAIEAISLKLDTVLLKMEKLDMNKGSDREKEPDIVTEKKRPDTDYIFQTCKSTKDIESKFSEFHYDKDKVGFVCLVCSSSETDVFHYEALEQDFSNSVQSDKFRFLKRNLKRHLLRQCHIEALAEIDAKHDVLLKEDNRNKAVGLRIGRICYYMFKKGRPDSDFHTLLYLHSSNDSDIGDINHSPEYASQFFTAVA